MQKLTPCLWFDFNAREAVDHYLAIFKDGKISDISHYPESSPGTPGKELMIAFEVKGQKFLALNGGPQFPFTEAFSISVNCADQKEIDYLWTKLGEGGTYSQCGWLKDKFGLSWQLVYDKVPTMLTSPDKAAVQRVFGAIMQMTKPDVAAMDAAFAGKAPAHA